MGAFSWLRPGNDHELAATRYAGRESASDRAARKDAEASQRRRAKYRANVFRNGDAATTKVPRRFRNHNSACN